MSYFPYMALGLCAILLQITALRELLTAFSGNELIVGVTLAIWLLSVGAGSFAGGRLRGKVSLGASFAALGTVAAPTLLAIAHMRGILGIGQGESPGLLETLGATSAVLFPMCFVLGMQFPLAVHEYANRPGHNARASSAFVYALEAVGAFTGGMAFSFVLSGRLDAWAIVLSVSLFSIYMAVYLTKRPVLIGLVIIPIVLFSGFGKPSQGGYVGEVQRTAESRYGRIVLTRLKEQYNLYSGGHLMYSYPDRETEETQVHLQLAAHPDPRRVLMIGGSPARIKEVLKYPIDAADHVEIDPALIRLSLDMLSADDKDMVRDDRVRIVAQDGRRFIKHSAAASYDVVMINMAEPSTAGANRFYTEGFFREVRNVMRNGGIVTVMLPASAGYVGQSTRLLSGSVYNALAQVFNRVETTSEEYGLLLASDGRIDTDPMGLVRRFESRHLSLGHFASFILLDAFDPLRAELYQRRLSGVSVVNTDERPAAYFYNLMLWAEKQQATLLGKLLALKGPSVIVLLVPVLVLAMVAYKNRRLAVYYAALTCGYSGMSVMLVVLLSFQAAFGYVYESFGVISALFMAGTALGGAIPFIAADYRPSMRSMVSVELLFAAFAILAAHVMSGVQSYYVISAVTGFFVGAHFALAGGLLMADGAHGGGRLYAADLAGACIGSMLSAIFFIPVLGMNMTLYTVAAIMLITSKIVFAVARRDA